MAIWKTLLTYKVYLVLQVASVIHLHCGSWDQRLSMPPKTSEDKAGSATLVYSVFHLAHLYVKHCKFSNTRSPSIIPFLIFFQPPNAAKSELQFICFFRWKNSEAGGAEPWQIPLQVVHYLNVILNISYKQTKKEKSTGGNKGLSLFLKSGFFDQRLRQHWKQDTRVKKPPGRSGLRTPVKSRTH